MGEKDSFFSLLIDCCPDSVVGEESYKGRYEFNNTLVSTNIKTACLYKNIAGVTFNSRKCNADLKIGPTWSDINLKDCLPKTKTTQDLILLNEVSLRSK